jgi:hypothetical protein
MPGGRRAGAVATGDVRLSSELVEYRRGFPFEFEDFPGAADYLKR